jgi:sarcosine oxidase subunit alpha
MSAHVEHAHVTIVVDDRECTVPAGISVAAALMQLGVTAFRRSVSGQPRAPLCGMGICHECRVEIDGVMSRRACLISVEDGLLVRTALAGEA